MDETDLERIQILIGLNRFDEAASALRNILSKHPDFGIAHSLLAFCLGNDPSKRQEMLDEARLGISLDPEEPGTYYFAACCFCFAQKTTEAKKAIEKAIQLDPINDLYICLHGRIQFQKKDFKKAEQSFRRALEINPENQETLSFLSRTLFVRGRRKEAEQTARQLLALNPEYSDAFVSHGLAMLNQNYEISYNAFLEALRLNPENKAAKIGLQAIRNRKNHNIPFHITDRQIILFRRLWFCFVIILLFTMISSSYVSCKNKTVPDHSLEKPLIYKLH